MKTVKLTHTDICKAQDEFAKKTNLAIKKMFSEYAEYMRKVDKEGYEWFQDLIRRKAVKQPFKIGDRVRAFSYSLKITGIIEELDGEYLLIKQDIGKLGQRAGPFHIKQCRRLKPKEKHPMEGKTFYASEIGNSYNMHNYLTANTNYSFTVSNIKRLKK